ncbi:EAL domain-containing protein [Geodermatophilus sabuli]|uniref:EAL domain-containing protein n=1 Tax=Geodermatophilus sabuli TaxID=1564158 RepID=UPI000BE30BAE|nr:EAL domain-containing protein [Geodermatophilus sabuli]MBB3082769.1 EAL domain-containing protein (putative c-di-GMP-specific phosphodiesterase class I) [Geodermatophilus sabuli]
MASTRGGFRRREYWHVPGHAGRVLLGGTDGDLLAEVARAARAAGLEVSGGPDLLDLTDDDGGRGIDRLFRRLARELTTAEAEHVRVATDPPAQEPALAARLLSAPTLAVELARRGVTAEIGVLAEAELWSVYQPIVRLSDRSVVAHEALLRGLVDGREVGGEDLFFVAESADWLPRLDRIGRESAILGAAPWLGHADLFVNSDPASVIRPQASLASTEDALHEAGIEPARLVVEVGEVSAVADRGHLLSVLEHYRSLGWRVALDDVAAGWSSRSLLVTVRPDVVKLGRALVQALPDDGARTMVRSVADLAHRLGAQVVAEGVETDQVAEEVAALGADLGQGWLFGRPVPPPAAEDGPTATDGPVAGVSPR